MRAEKMSETEQRIYQYIAQTIKQEGFAPSVRDIQSALSIKSTSTVHSYLARLAEKGLIQKENGKSRTIRIDSPMSTSVPKTVSVPLIGKVAAGVPILATENFEGYLDYPLFQHTYRQGELFALRIHGTSMIEAGILDGDVIIVRKENSAENGQIVVALVNEEATVKTFYKENGHFRLQPENHTMQPIILNEVMILGRVIANFRFY